MRRRRNLRAIVTAGALALSLGACGSSDEPPGEAVPALATTLTAVESALGDGDNVKAEALLNKLVASTERNREAGKISEEEADRILAAIARLTAALPESSTSPPEETPVEPVPEASDEDKKDGDDKDEEKKDKKDEDGKGNDDGD